MDQRADRLTAQICHRAAGRLRLRVPALVERPWLLATLDRALQSIAGVSSVDMRARTGSIVLRHTGEADDLLGRIAANTPLDIEAGPTAREPIYASGGSNAAPSWTRYDRSRGPHHPADVASTAMRALNGALRRATRNELELRDIVFLALLAGATIQFLRGKVGTPAVTLLWYAAALTPDLFASDDPLANQSDP